MKSKHDLRIQFYNPNDKEETVKFIVRLIAEGIAGRVVSQNVQGNTSVKVNQRV